MAIQYSRRETVISTALGLALGMGCGAESAEPIEASKLEQKAAPCPPSKCGKNSGLVPFHKDAIHASLIWRHGSHCPKLLIWMRPSEYRPSDYLAPTVGGVFSGFNPTYVQLVQGGFNLGPLDRSGWSRYSPDIERENAQLVDVCGLQDLIDRKEFTKTNIADLTEEDLSATDPFFEDAGFSKGLNYNLFCAGHVAGTDGRIYVTGGHDKGGNNGIKKITIFDPEREKWEDLPVPCVRSEFEDDPGGTYEHCSALDEDNTDRPSDSDMKYQRWYPSALTLPNGKILILSGSDQNTEVGPELASSTKVRQAVPEIYDPRTDTTVVLENARRLMPMYPRSFVVQTGRGLDDWKVCSLGKVIDPLPGTPGGPNITEYDPFLYKGETACLDVLAALADRHRDKPASKHWTELDTANNAHDAGAAVLKVTITKQGTWSQEMFAFGGSNNAELAGGVVVDSPVVATVESIDFSAAKPRWRQHDNLLVPTRQNNAAVLPDGKILVVGGRDNLQYQMFDPSDGSITGLIHSPVPRHDHSTLLQMPNGGVWVMGGNRTDLLSVELENSSVPVLEFYSPPYLFQGHQPKLAKAPARIHYGKHFEIAVKGRDSIGSVVLIRTGPVTHNWSWGNRYVSLPFEKHGHGKWQVKAPPLPGLAVPGDYLLFAVTKDGVPSHAHHVRLGR